KDDRKGGIHCTPSPCTEGSLSVPWGREGRDEMGEPPPRAHLTLPSRLRWVPPSPPIGRRGAKSDPGIIAIGGGRPSATAGCRPGAVAPARVRQRRRGFHRACGAAADIC